VFACLSQMSPVVLRQCVSFPFDPASRYSLFPVLLEATYGDSYST
jgi:hypothetical protein